MQEFGKILAKAHELTKKANIRYEGPRLCLPRNSAQDITSVGHVSDVI